MIPDFLKITNVIDGFLSMKEGLRLLNKLLLIECQHNLNLINCLKSNPEQQSEETLSIISLLEMETLQLFLSDKIKSKTLLDKVIDKTFDKIEDQKEDLVFNIILKIKILKSISSLPFKEKSGYKRFRLLTRLNSLKKKLEQLKSELQKVLP